MSTCGAPSARSSSSRARLRQICGARSRYPELITRVIERHQDHDHAAARRRWLRGGRETPPLLTAEVLRNAHSSVATDIRCDEARPARHTRK